LYAFGEIVLVVVGILIALSINNWNEQRKNTKLEHQYLTNLKANLLSDINQLNTTIDSITIRSDQLNQVKEILSHPYNYEISDLHNVLHALFKFHPFTTTKATFDNLNSSGQLTLIKNQTIVDNLFMYYRQIDQYIVSDENPTESYTRDHIVPYFMRMEVISFFGVQTNKGNPSLIEPKSLMEYAKDPFVINAIEFKDLLILGQLNSFDLLLEMNKALVKLIDKDI